MLKQVFRIATLLSLVIVVAACGRRLPDEYFQTTTDFVEEPTEIVTVAEASDAEAEDVEGDVEVENSDEVGVETDTTEDSAEEATEEEPETEVVVEADVAEPQVELVEVPLDPIIEQVANANPANGEELMGTGVACTSCHTLNSESMLVGPGFLNIPIRAENRIEDVVAERYLYNSIIHPNDYVVDGFAEGVMPAIYADTYSESDLLDIVAYLMTLGEYPEREPQFIEVVVESSGDVEADLESEADAETSDETADASTDETASEDVADEETAEAVETADPDDAPETIEIDLSGVPATVDLLAEHGSIIQGAALFDVQLVNGMSCSTCHSLDGNPSDSQSDLSEIASRDNAAAYSWAAIFNNDLHPGLGAAYQQELTNAETSHLVAYLLSFNASEDD